MARIQNQLIAAITKKIILPKVIIVVMDDDVIRDIVYEGPEVKSTYRRVLDWLTREFHRSILSQKDHLPNRSCRYKYPSIIWIAPPTNVKFYNSDLHRLFSYALEDATAKYPEMWTLQLKKIWDEQDMNLYDDNAHRYYHKGLSMYWRVVDSTLKFWDNTLSHKQIPKQPEGTTNFPRQSQDFNKKQRSSKKTFRNDRFHWKNNTIYGRKLPKI